MIRRGFLGRLAGALATPLLPRLPIAPVAPVYGITAVMTDKIEDYMREKLLTITMPSASAFVYNVYTGTGNTHKAVQYDRLRLVERHKP